jgi:DhnA family fructose-bisphosphate aldolase class Ia
MISPKMHRWDRIFREDGRTFIVAMDHASVFGTMPGLEKPGEVIRKVRAGGADAILTTYGICMNYMDAIGNMGIILRCDGGTSMLAKQRGPMRLIYDVVDALRLGADAVGIMGMPGSHFESDTMPYLSELAAQCNEWHVPLLAEMLPAGFENPGEWWTPANMANVCRIGAELGVDFIKTNYTGDVASFRTVVEATYVPIVVLGGSKSKEPADLLTGISDALQAGAKGVAVGRNIYQHETPDKVTAAIAAVIHDGATVDAALEYLK